MKVSILGTGKMGSAVGRKLVSAGYDVVFGSRNPGMQGGKFADENRISVKDYAEAAREGDVAIIAVPWAHTLDLIRSLRAELDGKVVVDLTNPLAADISHLVVGGTNSAAEQVAELLSGSMIVKAFNGITADNFQAPRFSGDVAQVFYCGDNLPAKKTVNEIIEACGYEGVDCGALTNARYLEGMAMLWLQLAFWEEWGGNFSFRVAHKDPPAKMAYLP
jgi:8-hydroxy-5-deazaflavin:NADPH oxidoreductase